MKGSSATGMAPVIAVDSGGIPPSAGRCVKKNHADIWYVQKHGPDIAGIHLLSNVMLNLVRYITTG
jgi:hypothetical protein